MSLIVVMLLVSLALVVGFSIGLNYETWKTRRLYRMIAKDLSSFASYRSLMEHFFYREGVSGEKTRLLAEATFARAVELVKYSDQAEWLLNSGFCHPNPVQSVLLKRLKQMCDQLPSQPVPAVPKTRVATPSSS
mgnify:CR=1 FL=1